MPDTESRSTAELESLLEDIGRAYGMDDGVAVEVGGKTAVSSDGQTVHIDADRLAEIARSTDGSGEALRHVSNALSHEVEHLRETDLESKQRISESNPDHAALAGTIANVVEDVYVDETRLQRYPGLRKSEEELTERVMADDNARPPVDTLEDREAQLVEGIIQAGTAGYVKGDHGIDDELWDELGDIHAEIERAAECETPEERAQLSEDVLERAVAFADRNELDSDRLDDAAGDALSEQASGQELGPGDVDGLGSESDSQPSTDDTPSGEGSDTPSEIDDAIEDEQARRESVPGGLLDSLADTLRDALGRFKPGESDDADDSDNDDSSDVGLGGTVEIDSPFDRERRRLEDEFDSPDVPEPVHNAAAEYEDLYNHPDVAPTAEDHSEKIRARVAASGLIDDVERAFRELKTRDVERPSRTGQRVNTRAAIRRLSGDRTEQNLYLNRERAALGDRTIGVALDCSGSMDMANAKTALYALAVAAETIGDSSVASAFGGGQANPIMAQRGVLDTLEARLPTITAPTESFALSQLDSAAGGGGTPTPAGIQAAGELVNRTSHRESVLFVLTDGRANVPMSEFTLNDWVGDREIEMAKDESKREIRRLRRTGTRVIGFDIEDDGEYHDEYMQELFGDDGYVSTEMSDLPQKLVETYREHVIPR